MFNFTRTLMFSLILAFSAMSVVGPAAAASMNFAMATSIDAADDMVGVAGEMKDCADQSASKATMKNCNLVCNATVSYTLVSMESIVFSEVVIASEHPMVRVQADDRTLTYDSPPPRSFILI